MARLKKKQGQLAAQYNDLCTCVGDDGDKILDSHLMDGVFPWTSTAWDGSSQAFPTSYADKKMLHMLLEKWLFLARTRQELVYLVSDALSVEEYALRRLAAMTDSLLTDKDIFVPPPNRDIRFQPGVFCSLRVSVQCHPFLHIP